MAAPFPPQVKQRISLKRGVQEDKPDWQPIDDDDEAEWVVTEVTVLARDLEEEIWTVWDHSDRCVKMVTFDENGNWFWIEPAEEITSDQA